jgi:hypothetical protein
MPSKIVLRCQGGFCNRFRAIASAVLWAEDLDARLEIYWPVEKGHMPAQLDHLIDPASIDRLTYIRNGYIRAKQVLSVEDMIASIQTSDHEVIIQSYSMFHDDLLKLTDRGLAVLRKIKVVPSITFIAHKAMPSLGEGLIGLHIRRTDHVKCIAASPLQAFEELVSKALSDHEGKGGYTGRFLLATDDAAVKERFRDLFGEAIVSPVVALGRMTESQQEMGVVDWLLLQGCQKIYASAGSSFSELAAWRAGIELVCVKVTSSA